MPDVEAGGGYAPQHCRAMVIDERDHRMVEVYRAVVAEFPQAFALERG